MKFKRGTSWEDAHPMLWYWLGKVEGEYANWAESETELTVTSMTRESPATSKHCPDRNVTGRCEAADIRRHGLDKVSGSTAHVFCRRLQTKFGRYLGIVLEPEWLTDKEIRARLGLDDDHVVGEAERKQISPHIHLQLKAAAYTEDLEVD